MSSSENYITSLTAISQTLNEEADRIRRQTPFVGLALGDIILAIQRFYPGLLASNMETLAEHLRSGTEPPEDLRSIHDQLVSRLRQEIENVEHEGNASALALTALSTWRADEAPEPAPEVTGRTPSATDRLVNVFTESYDVPRRITLSPSDRALAEALIGATSNNLRRAAQAESIRPGRAQELQNAALLHRTLIPEGHRGHAAQRRLALWLHTNAPSDERREPTEQELLEVLRNASYEQLQREAEVMLIPIGGVTAAVELALLNRSLSQGLDYGPSIIVRDVARRLWEQANRPAQQQQRLEATDEELLSALRTATATQVEVVARLLQIPWDEAERAWRHARHEGWAVQSVRPVRRLNQRRLAAALLAENAPRVVVPNSIRLTSNTIEAHMAAGYPAFQQNRRQSLQRMAYFFGQAQDLGLCPLSLSLPHICHSSSGDPTNAFTGIRLEVHDKRALDQFLLERVRRQAGRPETQARVAEVDRVHGDVRSWIGRNDQPSEVTTRARVRDARANFERVSGELTNAMSTYSLALFRQRDGGHGTRVESTLSSALERLIAEGFYSFHAVSGHESLELLTTPVTISYVNRAAGVDIHVGLGRFRVTLDVRTYLLHIYPYHDNLFDGAGMGAAIHPHAVYGANICWGGGASLAMSYMVNRDGYGLLSLLKNLLLSYSPEAPYRDIAGFAAERERLTNLRLQAAGGIAPLIEDAEEWVDTPPDDEESEDNESEDDGDDDVVEDDPFEDPADDPDTEGRVEQALQAARDRIQGIVYDSARVEPSGTDGGGFAGQRWTRTTTTDTAYTVSLGARETT